MPPQLAGMVKDGDEHQGGRLARPTAGHKEAIVESSTSWTAGTGRQPSFDHDVLDMGAAGRGGLTFALRLADDGQLQDRGVEIRSCPNGKPPPANPAKSRPTDVPRPTEIPGPWEVRFPAGDDDTDLVAPPAG